MASGHWRLMWLMWLLITTASIFEQKSHALQDLALGHSVGDRWHVQHHVGHPFSLVDGGIPKFEPCWNRDVSGFRLNLDQSVSWRPPSPLFLGHCRHALFNLSIVRLTQLPKMAKNEKFQKVGIQYSRVDGHRTKHPSDLTQFAVRQPMVSQCRNPHQ